MRYTDVNKEWSSNDKLQRQLLIKFIEQLEALNNRWSKADPPFSNLGKTYRQIRQGAHGVIYNFIHYANESLGRETKPDAM